MLARNRSLSRSDYAAAMSAHVHSFFGKHVVTKRTFGIGPIVSVAPDFHALEVAPGSKTRLWTYVSVGAGLVGQADAPQVEFVLVAPEASDRHVELLAMTTYYHRTQRLGLGHTFPLGQPWLPGSSLDHMLVSRLYPFGPDLEIFANGEMHAQLLWLLPITEAERDFKKMHGLEALESHFDEAAIEYWNPSRRSVVELDAD
jgi:Suppressor of fused protein (SUFU)